MPIQMRDTMEDYQRDVKRARLDESPSEEDILRLLCQRESLRQARRFSESDAIREELRAMGIELFDKEREWRSHDGRRGTLFTAGPAECTLSDEEIQSMVQEREDSRSTKEWERADAMRDHLRQLGVELNDKESVWRTSSGRSGHYSGMPVTTPTPPSGITIRKLIAERERLRAAHCYDGADEIRRQLAQMGVEISDNERLWRTLDGQQGVIVTGGHEVDCFLSDSEISARVMQREAARSSKKWEEADKIREELRKQGVEVLDNQKVWCTTDGRHGSYGGSSGANNQASRPQKHEELPQQALAAASGLAQLLKLFQQPQAQQAQQTSVPQKNKAQSSPPAGVTSGQTLSDSSIQALVSGRERAREKHDWTSADAIRADLRAVGVEVWDKDKIWRANDGRSGPIS